MSTRQTRNTKLGRFVIPAISLTLIAYFGYHAWSGRFGIENMRKLQDEAVRLEFELASVKLKRKELEKRVMLLRDGTMERDMLDEQARAMLNLLSADEVAVLRTRNGELN